MHYNSTGVNLKNQLLFFIPYFALACVALILRYNLYKPTYRYTKNFRSPLSAVVAYAAQVISQVIPTTILRLNDKKNPSG